MYQEQERDGLLVTSPPGLDARGSWARVGKGLDHAPADRQPTDPSYLRDKESIQCSKVSTISEGAG